MEIKCEFQTFPWSSNREFQKVLDVILLIDFNSNLLQNSDFLKDLKWAERQLVVWKTKCSSNYYHEIDATISIINCIVLEYSTKLSCLLNKKSEENLNDNDCLSLKDNCLENTTNIVSEQNFIDQNLLNSIVNEETLSSLYSTTVLKFFKMISYYDVINGEIERCLSRSESNLIRIFDKLNLPQYIIEYRHRIAHNKSPSCKQLKLAIQISLNWIKNNFWLKYKNLLDGQNKSKILIKEQMDIFLSNLFEPEKTSDQNIKKLKKLKTEKNYDEVFNSLSKNDISSLYDLFYDYFTEDVFTTLQSITNYLVTATNDHLKDITEKQMINWLIEDEERFNQQLKSFSNKKKLDDDDNKKTMKSLIPYNMLIKFKPIFDVLSSLNDSSINQVLFYLYSTISDGKISVKTSALVWFIQIISSLVNNLNFQIFISQNSNLVYKKVLNDFEKCFKLTERQLLDLKWIHLFTIITEKPILGKLSLVVAKRLKPFVSIRYKEKKFNKILDLLSIYIDDDLNLNQQSKKDKNQQFKKNQIVINQNDDMMIEEFISKNFNLENSEIDWSKMKFGFM